MSPYDLSMFTSYRVAQASVTAQCAAQDAFSAHHRMLARRNTVVGPRRPPRPAWMKQTPMKVREREQAHRLPHLQQQEEDSGEDQEESDDDELAQPYATKSKLRFWLDTPSSTMRDCNDSPGAESGYTTGGSREASVTPTQSHTEAASRDTATGHTNESATHLHDSVYGTEYAWNTTDKPGYPRNRDHFNGAEAHHKIHTMCTLEGKKTASHSSGDPSIGPAKMDHTGEASSVCPCHCLTTMNSVGVPSIGLLLAPLFAWF